MKYTALPDKARVRTRASVQQSAPRTSERQLRGRRVVLRQLVRPAIVKLRRRGCSPISRIPNVRAGVIDGHVTVGGGEIRGCEREQEEEG